MSSWIVKRTDSFLKYLKKHRNNHELIRELGKKISRLKEDPLPIGGLLSGSLHGLRSTRLTSNFRLIFRIDEETNIVYLVAIDHRGGVYN